MDEKDFPHKAVKLNFQFNKEVGNGCTYCNIDYSRIISKYPDFRGYWTTDYGYFYDYSNLQDSENIRDVLTHILKVFEFEKIFIEFENNEEDDLVVYGDLLMRIRNELITLIDYYLKDDDGGFTNLDGFSWDKDYSWRREFYNRGKIPFPMSDCFSEDLLDLIDMNTGIDLRKIEIEKWL